MISGEFLKITTDKAVDQIRHDLAQVHGGGMVRGEGEVNSDSHVGEFDQMMGDEPSPALAAMVAENCRRLLNLLEDPCAQGRGSGQAGRLHQSGDRRAAEVCPAQRAPPPPTHSREVAPGRRFVNGGSGGLFTLLGWAAQVRDRNPKRKRG